LAGRCPLAGERIREVTGTGLPLRGDDIDTDRIIPARFLKSVSFDGLEQHLFEDDRRQAEAAGIVHPASNAAFAGASIMLVQTNFGCGSSREHAPQAIQRRGIRAIVGRSFSEIFFGNAVALGMPCVAAGPDAVEALIQQVEREPATELVVNLDAMRVCVGARGFEIRLPAGARESLLDGSWDATGRLLDDYAAVRRTAALLPYVHW
jgi:3-isopropylmalate/(R)-2-methylmalate dehydratase small subunit